MAGEPAGRGADIDVGMRLNDGLDALRIGLRAGLVHARWIVVDEQQRLRRRVAHEPGSLVDRALGFRALAQQDRGLPPEAQRETGLAVGEGRNHGPVVRRRPDHGDQVIGLQHGLAVGDDELAVAQDRGHQPAAQAQLAERAVTQLRVRRNSELDRFGLPVGKRGGCYAARIEVDLDVPRRELRCGEGGHAQPSVLRQVLQLRRHGHDPRDPRLLGEAACLHPDRIVQAGDHHRICLLQAGAPQHDAARGVALHGSDGPDRCRPAPAGRVGVDDHHVPAVAEPSEDRAGPLSGADDQCAHGAAPPGGGRPRIMSAARRCHHAQMQRWESLGGTPASAPAVTSWAEGEMQTFCIFADGQLWNRYWDGEAWHPVGDARGRADREPGRLLVGLGSHRPLRARQRREALALLVRARGLAALGAAGRASDL